ncbi:MAG: NADH-quinone oxidoreductase subunit NuoG [Thermodesulfovibrionales bacterium]|nr:NADH-quinone oxidoreductase subunit NuoG [Thermodesulfovibrionales bacterium]
MITITINNKEIRLERPVTVLEAAKANGIKIPHFCHHGILEQWGGCRMCLVEVEKMPRLQTACTLFVTDGMVVMTESETISNARRSVLEFILINHPLDCPVCDKAGECKLQDYVMQYGPTAGRFKEPKIRHPEGLNDPLIVRNQERCIMCTRCVRMCSGIQGASAIAVTNRGNHSSMEPFSGERFDCEYCGNCLTVCPVGAIMSRLHRYSYRSWQVTDEIQTVCPFCGVGCTMIAQVRDNALMRVVPKLGLGSNKGLLCNRGRFGYEYVGSGERLKNPLIKKNGKLQPASWEEALDTVASRLKDIKNSSGGNAIAGIAGARCTNEDNYAFQKLIRGLGSNNIDSIARMGFAGGQRIFEGMLGPGVTSTPLSGIADSDAVLVVGGDPSEVNPVLGVHIRMAFKKGAKVITIGHAPGLGRHRTAGLLPHPQADGVVMGGLISAILKDKKSLPGGNRPLEEKITVMHLPSADDAAAACKLSAEDIGRLAKQLAGASSVSIVVGREAGGNKDTAMLVSVLSYILNARIYLMSERPNEQGLVDMGCLPDMLPGGRPLAEEGLRKKCGASWGIDIPADEGLTLMEMIQAASSGGIKAMYVMGENPAFNLPDTKNTEEALRRLDFLVVQDIFMTETARMADVVLPALSWIEKDGTYTNAERKIQRLKKAISITGMEDWKIVAEVGKRIGLKMPYGKAADIMKEIARVSPLHAGLTYADIEGGDNLWPYKGEPHKNWFSFPELSADAFTSPAEEGLCLMLEKPLFHSGTLSRKSPALNSISPEAVLRLSPATASGLNLKDGDFAKVSTEKGSLSLKVKIDRGIDGPAAFVSNNFEGRGLFSLTGYRLDPVTKSPLTEGRQISIEKE